MSSLMATWESTDHRIQQRVQEIRSELSTIMNETKGHATRLASVSGFLPQLESSVAKPESLYRDRVGRIRQTRDDQDALGQAVPVVGGAVTEALTQVRTAFAAANAAPARIGEALAVADREIEASIAHYSQLSHKSGQ
jgi:aspartate/tyrosine/aromatic aminotransferase